MTSLSALPPPGHTVALPLFADWSAENTFEQVKALGDYPDVVL